MSALADALRDQFDEAVALDAGFSGGGPPDEWWEDRASAVRALVASYVLPDGFTRCPLCGDAERDEDIVGGVCLTCADGIAYAQNARRGAIVVPYGTAEGEYR